MAKVPIYSDFQQEDINQAFSRNLPKSLAKPQVSAMENLWGNRTDLLVFHLQHFIPKKPSLSITAKIMF